MKVERKTKAAKNPPAVKTVKSGRRASPKTNGKHPLLAYEHIPIGIVEVSLDGKYMDVNEEFCRILGYSRQELLRLGIKACTHEDDYAIDAKLYEQLITEKIPFYRMEKRYLRKGGGEIWVELTRTLVCDEKGKPRYSVGVVLDISDRKDVERVLRDSVERLRLATGAAQIFMWEWDFQTQSYTLDDNFEQVLGFSAGLLPRNKFETIWALSPQEDVQRISESFEKAVENQTDLSTLPCRVINPENSQIVWLEVSAKIVYDEAGNPQRMFGVAQNITESKNIQDEITVISRMPEENPNPVMRLKSEGKVLYANPASAALLEDWMQGAQPAIPEELLQTITQAFASDRKMEVEIGHQGKHFSFTVAPIVDSGYVNLYGKDITQRQKAELALQKSENQLRLVTDAMPALIAYIDHDYRYRFVNRTYRQWFGYEREEILGKTMVEVLGAAAFEKLLPYLKSALAGNVEIFETETPYQRGGTRFIRATYTPDIAPDGAVNGLFVLVLDVTERKRSEESLSEYARQQAALYTLSDQLHRTGSLEEVYDAALEAILNALHCDRASILLCDDSDVMHFVAWRGLSDAYRKATDGHAPWKPDVKDPQPVVMDDVRTADLDDPLRAVIQKEGIGALAFIPLVVNEKLIGKFMIYYNASHAFDEAELDLSLTIAHQLAFGIDRKRADVQLRQSEERFRNLANAMPSMVWTAAPDGTITYANDQWFHYVGISPEENAKRWPELVLHPDDYERCVREWNQALEAVPDEYLIEVRNRRHDGEYRWFQTRAVPVRDASGKALTWYGVTTDIHERIQAEQRLTLLAEITEMLRNADDPHELMYAISKAIGEQLGVKRVLFNEIDLEHDREIVHRDYHSDLESVAGVHKVSDYSSLTSAEVAAGKTVVNVDSKSDPRTAQDYERTYAWSGERSYVVVPMMRDNRWVASLWVSDDMPHTWTKEEVSLLETIAERTWTVIERLRINVELRESEERYRFIVENTSDGIWWIELTEPMPISLSEEEQIDWYYNHAVIRQCNLGMARMYGYDSIEDVVGLPIRVVMPRENPVNLALSQQFIRSGYRLVDAESREKDRDGHELVFLNNMVGILEDGKLKGEWGTNRDITERKRAEEALRRNEKMFSTLVDAAPFGVYFIDADFRLRSINKGAEPVFSGIHPLIGRDFAEILHIIWKEPFATEAIERFRHTLHTGESFISPPVVEERANVDEIEAYDWQIHRITLGDGTYGVVCYFYDLSSQKKMEATVRASEALYRAIARSIPGGGVYVVDKDFRYLVAEGPVTEAFRLTREMLEGHTVREVFPDERGAGMEERLRRTFAGEIVSFETQFNGRVYWTQQAPLLDSIGHAIIVTLDITGRKQAEEALRQSEERFARFMQYLPGLAWIKDVEGRYVYANAAAEKAFNTPREKLYGKTDQEIFPLGVASQFKQNDEKALVVGEGVQVVETLKQEDGILHHSLVTKFPIPGAEGNTALIGGTAFDITERLQAEEALRESEERFRAILRQATAGIVRKDAEGRLVFVNEAFCNMLGRTQDELLGRMVWDFMHPNDIAENKRSYQRLMLEGAPFKQERRFLREDGSVIWVDASVSPIVDAQGKPQSAVAVEVDITGRKHAEEALQQLNLQLEDRVLTRTAKLREVNQTLREEIKERKKVEAALRKSEAAARENEEKLSTLFDLLPVGISFLDPEGRIIQKNPALTNMLKLAEEYLADQPYDSRKYIRANGSLMPPVEFASRRAVAEGKTIYNVETGVFLEDGELVWTSVSAAPVDVADVGAVVVTVDITESKRAERALQENRERLQILSQRLVEVQEEERRSIARELHDRVGQTLAALNINLIIIGGQLGGKVDEQVSTRLNDSMKLVAETIALVRDVMSNLRPSVLDDYGLEAAIESHLAQYLARYEIDAKLEKPASPLPRLGPSIEMTFLRIAQEALMNIAKHAHASQVTVRLQEEENAVRMTIQDNGIGIESWSEANRPGSHGLTIMRERAEAFGGSLMVDSIPGQGTKVEVKIPIENNNPPQAPKETNS
jgi:PAS domain S-box-containing protein